MIACLAAVVTRDVRPLRWWVRGVSVCHSGLFR